MIVVGALVHLEPGAAGERAAAACAEHERLRVGARTGARLPVAATSPDRQEDRRLWAWLEALPGVSFIDFAFAAFEPANESNKRD